ncbi:MAG: hypothetical protein K9L30_08405 [Desulfobacterales bacterium]|nr:hypothetical protein [Desulfobacterales bacterium]
MTFKIASHKRNDDQVYDIAGNFDGTSAWELANKIRDEDKCCGKCKNCKCMN